MIRIILCDDEQRFIDEYKDILYEIAEKDGLEIGIKEFTSCEKLLFEISDNPDKADLIYMDINFGDHMDGMNASLQLRKLGYSNDIVFLTGDKDQVFDSFDVDPINYIVKGSDGKEKFEAVLLKAEKRRKRKNREYLALSCAGDSRNIPMDSILYFEMVRRIIEVHYDDKIFEFYSTMGKLENMLSLKGFKRVHRSYLVSEDHISSIKGSEITMDNGDVIPVGRTYVKELKQDMERNS